MIKPSLARPPNRCEKASVDVDRNWPRPATGYRGVELAKPETKDQMKPRERLLGAAYELFATKGIGQVGIDTILEKSGCAKASLYSNFNSKVDLAIAFLDRRETVWTRGWLETEIRRRASTPEQRLLAIFDVFDGWFRKKTFEGCSFINVLLESEADSPVRRAAAIHLAKIRAGLAYADEGFDRFSWGRQQECCARRQTRRPIDPRRLVAKVPAIAGPLVCLGPTKNCPIVHAVQIEPGLRPPSPKNGNI